MRLRLAGALRAAAFRGAALLAAVPLPAFFAVAVPVAAFLTLAVLRVRAAARVAGAGWAVAPLPAVCWPATARRSSATSSRSVSSHSLARAKPELLAAALSTSPATTFSNSSRLARPAFMISWASFPGPLSGVCSDTVADLPEQAWRSPPPLLLPEWPSGAR